MAQSRFRSRSEHTLDAKGRLNFPSRFREVLRQHGSDVLMVAPWKDHLRAYPMAEWEILETKLLKKGGSQKKLGKFVRYIIGGVVECSLDRQGRILLPPALRKGAGLEKEVVLTGMVDWVEIWDQKSMEVETQTTLEDFDEIEEGLSELEIF